MPIATSVSRSAAKKSSRVAALNTPLSSSRRPTPGRRTSASIGRRAKTAPTIAAAITMRATIRALSGIVGHAHQGADRSPDEEADGDHGVAGGVAAGRASAPSRSRRATGARGAHSWNSGSGSTEP